MTIPMLSLLSLSAIDLSLGGFDLQNTPMKQKSIFITARCAGKHKTSPL
jgi:hypothetical protein